MYEDLLLERVGSETTAIFNLLLQSNWLDYSHFDVFIESLHQQGYNVLKKGFAAGLSNEQIYNLFSNQGTLYTANKSSLAVGGY